jgi:hypothetical protein
MGQRLCTVVGPHVRSRTPFPFGMLQNHPHVPPDDVVRTSRSSLGSVQQLRLRDRLYVGGSPVSQQTSRKARPQVCPECPTSHVFAPDGKRIGKIHLPEVCTNLALAAPGRTPLYGRQPVSLLPLRQHRRSPDALSLTSLETRRFRLLGPATQGTVGSLRVMQISHITTGVMTTA